jgi:hypothetical protein
MGPQHDRLLKAVGFVWILGYAAMVLAKHTLFADSWGSPDLALHWHYWAWQATWTVLAGGVVAVVARLGKR